MMGPITEQQVLASISRIFHDEFRRLKETRFQPNEMSLATGDCSVSYHHMVECGFSFGFVVVTTYRVILTCFRGGWGRSKLCYYKEGSAWDSSRRKGFWYPSSSTLISKSELKTREGREDLLSSITGIQRKEFSVGLGRQQHRIIDLRCRGVNLDDYYMALDFDSGEIIYNLIQNKIRQDGGSQREGSSYGNEFISQLERLSALHQANKLTDEEFKAAKRQLIRPARDEGGNRGDQQ